MNSRSDALQKDLPPLKYALPVLVAYCLHNGWNCWTFLNASVSEGPAEELFGVERADLGWLTTAGWCGIFSCMPLSIFCTWRRTLLFCAGAVNSAAPLLRYFAAAHKIFVLECLSFFLTGAAYSIIGVWAPIIAACFFQPHRWPLVTALGGVSNFVAGGLAAAFMPSLSGETSAGLLRVFECQTYISSVLALSMLCWIWIPSLDEERPLSLREEFRMCSNAPIFAHICLYGFNIGISAALQGLDAPLLEGVGISSQSAGFLSCLYQVSAIFSIYIGSWITSRRRLQRLIHWLHIVQVATCGCWLVVCWFVSKWGSSIFAIGVLVVAQILQGVSQMGSFPFFLQEVVCLSNPARENFSGGFTLLVGMGLAMLLNQVGMSVAPLVGATMVFVFLLLETMLYGLSKWYWRDSEILRDPKLESFTGSHIGSHAGSYLFSDQQCMSVQ